MSEKAEGSSAVETAEVAAHTLLLRRGTYCIYVVAISPGLTDAQLPGLGVSAAPGEQDNTLELARLSGEPWLRRVGDALLLRVHAPQIRLLLTSYNMARAKGATPPKVEIQRLDAPPPVAAAAAAPVDNRAADVIVHVRNRGDIRGQFGEWVGDLAGSLWIEGFTIATPTTIEAPDLQYQAVLGKGWTSPWVSAGEYCGTRGLQIPIQGLRLRVNGDGNRKHAGMLAVSLRYADGTVQETLPVGALCALDPLQPVIALRVEIVEAPVPKAGGTSRAARRVGALISRRPSAAS